ncbi:hypothetical protein HRQ91_06410 [Treponema parvum]|uniref:Uncharacterized protein n=1 Tax=Treponema parvum TaxID=138851 RepID=A0A975F4H9_9SPIR|nr:hypothetical protein [Treponema parvum]QTQ14118.1 hypothetical protein HRQ91_06410 [Treponema parvum]
MIDSDNKNALDNYGVWVKKSPKDIPSEDSTSDMTAEDSFDITADLPDFSSIDDKADNSASKDNFAAGETSLTSEELLNITDNITETDSIESGKPLDDANKDADADDIFDQSLEDTKDISDGDPFDISFDDEGAQEDKQKGETQNEYELPDIDDMIQENSAANPLPTFDDIELTDEVKEEAKNEPSADEDFFADMDFDEKDDNASDKPETIDIDENIAENADTTDEISWGNDILESDEDTVSTISTDSAENPEIHGEAKNESEKPDEEGEDISAERNTFVPDIFDEETASFTDEVLDQDVKEDQSYAAPLSDDPKFSVDAKDEIINRSNAILEQIQKELLSLQNEISSLKSDFAEFKSGNVKTENASAPDDKKGGFFSDIDEDETISLSGDELKNIMNNADFTEEQNAAQTPNEDVAAFDAVPATESADDIAPIPVPMDDDSSVDFDGEHLEEPSTEDLKPGEGEEDSEIIPEEMSVPKIEDVLVESSSVDLIDSAGSSDSDAEIDDTVEDSSAELDSAEDLSAAELDESAEDLSATLDDNGEPSSMTALDNTDNSEPPQAEKDEASEELPPMEDFFEDVQTAQESGGQEDADLNTLDELYPKDPPIADALTEDTLNYLNKDSEQEIETLEEAAKQIPFSNDADAESSTGMPKDLTKDIKAVLSYMDQLLENLPDEKISEFARSEQFVTYKKLFTELGLA